MEYLDAMNLPSPTIIMETFCAEKDQMLLPPKVHTITTQIPPISFLAFITNLGDEEDKKDT